MKRIILFALILSFVACKKEEQNTPDTFQLGYAFELSAEHTQKDCECGGLSVKYLEVSEDSRCPTNVLCVWEGRAVVDFEITLNGEQFNMQLIDRAGQTELARDTIGNYIFNMSPVEPYPLNANEEIEPEDYRIIMTVTGL